jgi:anti-anti-sigma factor
LAERPATLVIDLTQARFFSSAALAILVLAHRSVEVALRVVARDQVVLRPLELTGLAEDLEIHSTLESALTG